MNYEKPLAISEDWFLDTTVSEWEGVPVTEKSRYFGLSCIHVRETVFDRKCDPSDVRWFANNVDMYQAREAHGERSIHLLTVPKPNDG